ncbi:outer membrane beta-barrel protein [Pontibacter lucknowensis]|uniref:Outer membrane protein beta-barrel domain-containing protein n=1 Tax=Pontibacter lucknowensis TaxID=1077936 RepID=A0A1N6TYG4_9BACT|nr:outer membrane beta-barrel protein [Pontibacter lucknowensis]SIQ58337.1 Outer membrane protein beta-barrel domain-containing protein [Pontibacter lucknowensis]
MSSANNHKRNTLEDEFQRRLFDAEARPAPDLWARIDHDLTVQENKDYKKRVLFYRQLAAACFVLFAVTGALLAYYYNGSMNQGGVQPGIAALPAAKPANAPVTVEEAMSAYAAQQEEASAMAYTPVEETAQANSAASAAGMRQGKQPVTAETSELSNEPQAGDYFNVAPGYSPYLGYTPMPGRSRGYVSGGFPGSNSGATQGSLFAPGNRYTQIITWESVTITFGNNTAAAGQPFPLGNQSMVAKPKSFAEMSEAHQASRQHTAEVAQGALAAQQSKSADAVTKSSSRWSLNLAYAPSVFEQNIGLPDPLAMPGSNNRNMLSIAASGPSVNASQESFQNMTAAREEFEESTQPAYSYAVEAKAGFKLKEKLKLLTGIGYSESRTRSKSNYIVRQFWVKPRSNERYELSPSTFFVSSLNDGFSSDSVSVARTGDAYATEYKYRHLTVPLGLQYEQDINKDWFMYVAAGAAANFLLESSVTASNQDVQSVSYAANDSESPFRNVQFSGNASVGVGKRITPNLTLALGPEVRHYFSTLVADPDKAAAPQGRPYAIGMNMSLNYQLNSSRK